MFRAETTNGPNLEQQYQLQLAVVLIVATQTRQKHLQQLSLSIQYNQIQNSFLY